MSRTMWYVFFDDQNEVKVILTSKGVLLFYSASDIEAIEASSAGEDINSPLLISRNVKESSGEALWACVEKSPARFASEGGFCLKDYQEFRYVI